MSQPTQALKQTPHSFTTLDPLETSVDRCVGHRPSDSAIAMASEHPHRNLHRGQWRERTHVIASLLDAPDAHVQKRGFKIRDCRLIPIVYVDDDGVPHTSMGACRDRVCPTCSRQRSLDVVERISNCIEPWRDLRLVTLTLDHRGEALPAMLNRLVSSYRRLRQSSGWKASIAGAIATIEVTRNSETGEWHAHMHVLTHGKYYPHSTLRESWRLASDGATIVHIERVNAHKAGASYIAKYVSKPAQIATWRPETVRAWADGMRGRRLLIATGDAHGKCVMAEKEKHPHARGTTAVAWYRIAQACWEGCPAAIALVARFGADLAGMISCVRDRLPDGWTCPPCPEEYLGVSCLALLDEISTWRAGMPESDRPPPRRLKRTCRPSDTPPMFDTGEAYYG